MTGQAGEAPIGIGVVGLGMAAAVMVPVIARYPRLRLAGACEPQSSLRERFEHAHGVPAFDNLEALIARSDVEALYIATPHQLHAEHVLLALRHGKHVVVEKPMALSSADCSAMIEAADAAGCTLVVGHTHGFDPGVRAIRELIENGEVGAPTLVNLFSYTNFLYRPRRPEELDPDAGGGVLWNQLPHQIDVARTIVGRPVRSVRSTAASLDPERRVDGLVAAFLEFDGGAAATLIYSGYDRFDSDEWSEWTGASGQSKKPAHGAMHRALPSDAMTELEARQNVWSYGGGSAQLASGTGLPHCGQLIVSCVQADIRQTPRGLVLYDRNGAREVELPPIGERPGHIAVFDELWGAVRCGVAPRHDGRFARETVEVCLAIAESARLRAEVRLGAVMDLEPC